LELLLDNLEQNINFSKVVVVCPSQRAAAKWQYLLEDGKPDLLCPTCSNFVSL